MGSHKNLIIEYIDMFFPGHTIAFFNELQSMIMDYDSPQAKAFLAWVDRDDSAPMFKDGKQVTTELKYFKELASKEHNTICFIMDDAKSALFAMPEGVNSAYYAAEVRLCDRELNSRR